MSADPPAWQFCSSRHRNDRSATGSSSSHAGEAAAFIPLSASAGHAWARCLRAPVAVAAHHGPLRKLDRACAALGGFAEQGLGTRTRTAIRENYLVSLLDNDNEHGLVTEVCWPVLSTRGERKS